MKKLFLTMAAVALMCSCGGNKSTSAGTDTETTTDSISATTTQAVKTLTNEIQSKVDEKDATAVQELLQQAETYIQQLVANGNSAEAKAYAAKVKEYIGNNAEALKALGIPSDVTNLIDAAAAAPEAASEKAANAVNDAKNAVNQTVENAKAAGKEVVDKAKEEATKKADEAVSKAKKDAADKVNKAIENTKKETTDKANKAIDNAKQKALKGLGL